MREEGLRRGAGGGEEDARGRPALRGGAGPGGGAGHGAGEGGKGGGAESSGYIGEEARAHGWTEAERSVDGRNICGCEESWARGAKEELLVVLHPSTELVVESAIVDGVQGRAAGAHCSAMVVGGRGERCRCDLCRAWHCAGRPLSLRPSGPRSAQARPLGVLRCRSPQCAEWSGQRCCAVASLGRAQPPTSVGWAPLCTELAAHSDRHTARNCSNVHRHVACASVRYASSYRRGA